MKFDNLNTERRWQLEIRNCGSIEELQEVIQRIPLNGQLKFFDDARTAKADEADEILTELHLLQGIVKRIGTLIRQKKIRRPV